MPGMAQYYNIPLPKGWPHRVRSAVIQVISLAHFSLTTTRSWAAHSWNARIRLKQDKDRLQQELALLREEIRLKDARMQRIPAQRRPHYPPFERLAILELRAARGWTLSQTARQLLVTPATVASWMTRMDEQGPGAIVRISQPVNKFPDFVGYIVRRLKVLCPTLGRVKIAQILCRAGLRTSVQQLCAACSGTHPDEAPWLCWSHPSVSWLPVVLTMSGMSTSPSYPLRSVSGPHGCHSPCPSAGPSAGGSQSPSITSHDGSWVSPSSGNSPTPAR